VSAGEGGLHTRYGQVFYGVTYPDQRFLGAEKGSTCEQDTCSRRVDLAYPFGCPTLAFYRITTLHPQRCAFAPNASIAPNKQTK
jgi:hypothetical protein